MNNGYNVLHLAALNHDKQIIGSIIDAAAEGQLDLNGCTQLYNAIANHNPENAIQCLNNGANPNGLFVIINNTAYNFLDLIKSSDLAHNSSLILTGKIQAFLNKRKRPLKLINDHPLFYATIYGYIQIVAALIKAGVPVNLKNKSGKTPLHFAAMYSYLDVVKVLIEAGANVNVQDDNGTTPLDFASNLNNSNHQNDDEAIQILLKQHGDKRFYELNK